MSRSTDALETPPYREFLLSLPATDPERRDKRRDIIVRRGNAIVTYSAFLEVDHGEDWLDRGFHWEGGPEATHELFRELREEWGASADAAELRSVFTENIASGRLPRIDKIVCFGLGTLTPEDVPYGYLQHAAALWFADLISRQTHRQKIPVYTQDPMLTRRDMEIFRAAGITPVNPYTMEGYVLVDHNTFVLSVSIDRSARLPQMVLEHSRPAVIIWSLMDKEIKDPANAAVLINLWFEYRQVMDCRALTHPEFDQIGLATRTALSRTELWIRRPLYKADPASPGEQADTAQGSTRAS
ncbi:hypothetical protein F4778DRAFT_761666 [Xylariomycetidae sp. FL2044]|nr:hypothetical protein F4778DRAFT_761666 [Xylariomycetidae sp. FL2044]